MLTPHRLLRLGLPLAFAFLLALASTSYAPPLPKGKENVNNNPEVEDAKPAAKPDDRASGENLKNLALAMHNYHDAMGTFPNNVTDKKGKALLSWRVQLLPYIEEDALYRRFKLDEPWDSKHNVRLVAEMPKVFASPRVTLKKKGYTVYQGFAGAGALFPPGRRGLRMVDITDGTSNTIMFVEATAAVPWTKPADVPFDEKKDVVKFGQALGERPLAAMCDGSTRHLDLRKISKETLKGAITTQGGEVLGADWE